MRMHVYTDGEHLFVATHVAIAKAMYTEAFGGDTLRDHRGRLRRLRPQQICTLLDEDDKEWRLQARTVARLYPGIAILAQ